MDLLVTVIGNAVADPAFRTSLLDDPRSAIDEWGFHLSKSEAWMLDAIFTKEKKQKLAKALDELEGLLLQDVDSQVVRCHQKPCPGFGCYPPATRADLRKMLDELRQQMGVQKHAA